MKRLLILGICLVLLIVSSAAACQPKETLLEIVVSVKVVGDEEYRLDRNPWQEEAGNLLEAVSKVYQKEFGICFMITEFIEWDSPDLKPVEEGWYDLAGTQWLTDNAAWDIPSDGTLVVVLTGEDLTRRNPGMSLVTERRGFKEYYALAWADSENPRNGLVHEIAHLFDAKHPNEEWGWEYSEKYPSIMDPAKVFSVVTFDPKNRKVILENRDKFQPVPQGGGS